MALTATKFHLSLNVANLPRSVAFHRILFGMEPAKSHDDYAKFELTDPPVVFSLVPQPALAGGALARIGLRLTDAEAVASVKARLDGAGLVTQTPADSGCCTEATPRCYVTDPDLNYWEITTGEVSEITGVAPAPTAEPAPSLDVAPGPVVWEHFVTQAAPERAPHADASVDEVRLTGTFNARLDESQRAFLVREALRVLRPGGKVLVHGLVGDKPFAAQPQLPGLAAMVSRVPEQTEPVETLRQAGFAGIQFVKFSEKPWFTIDGVELREVKVVAWKAAAVNGETRRVVYRGPFLEAVDDAGTVYPRGRSVLVSAATYELLQKSVASEQFEFPTADGLCPR